MEIYNRSIVISQILRQDIYVFVTWYYGQVYFHTNFNGKYFYTKTVPEKLHCKHKINL